MTDSPTSIAFHEDLQYAYFGDTRLTDRLVHVASALAANASLSFPGACATEADVTGLYRFMDNERVTFDGILEPHHAATAARCGELSAVRIIHDTTTAMFRGEVRRQNMGRVNGNDQGFLLHLSLATTVDAVPSPLGILAATAWTREPKKRKPKGKSKAKKKRVRGRTAGRQGEFIRWEEQALDCENQLPEGTCAIHIIDAEGDAYGLLAALSGCDFVIRADGARVVVALDAPLAQAQQRLDRVVDRTPIALERMVPLSRRSANGRTPQQRKEHPPREARLAQLSICATEVLLRRPERAPADLPALMPMHVVQVVELDPPEDCEPVEWLLLTKLPIETAEQIAVIVDHYRARWLIEEFNKALKTGCSLEDRQLESLERLLNATAIFLPIACQMLALRAADRVMPDAPATVVLSETQVAILCATPHLKLPASPTVHEALGAVARMGGHMPHNGPPGWLILARGFRKLQALEQGWLLGRAAERM